IGEASEMAEELAAGEEETGEDTGAAFTADETEFNIFNTDCKLSALQTATTMLASLPEKKALVYFSSGVGRTGVENESQLRATINAAVKSNVSFYPIDARGLVAEAPLGDSRRGGSRGSSMYSGKAQRQRRDRFLNQQETLYTLAEDTGGKAFLDSNDLSRGIVEAKEDIASYYILGYYPANVAEDGRYRRIKVRLVSSSRAKLDYRSGYFARKQFKDFDSDDRERQLEEALVLGDPITDLRLALEVNYFRRGRDRYIVPVAEKVPGSEIELARKRDREQARLDFIGQVRDKGGSVMGVVRDHITVKLKGAEAEQVRGRHLQYDSAFSLPPGEYSLKFLVRENETGKMGTFETSFAVPDISAEDSYLRLSSVVWSNQREALDAAVGAAKNDRRSRSGHPFIRDGQKLIPSITRVFRRDQDLYVYFEAYDPGEERDTEPSVMSSLSFYRGGVKVFESDSLRLRQGRGRRSAGALTAEFQIPLETLAGGEYICQVNVVDQVGRKFNFERAPMVVLP
ncbi:MAG: VWA domain-containing protein, partial [bacterium]|nr:VWA domain-containing protein [bacterium]